MGLLGQILRIKVLNMNTKFAERMARWRPASSQSILSETRTTTELSASLRTRKSQEKKNVNFVTLIELLPVRNWNKNCRFIWLHHIVYDYPFIEILIVIYVINDDSLYNYTLYPGPNTNWFILFLSPSISLALLHILTIKMHKSSMDWHVQKLLWTEWSDLFWFLLMSIYYRCTEKSVLESRWRRMKTHQHDTSKVAFNHLVKQQAMQRRGRHDSITNRKKAFFCQSQGWLYISSHDLDICFLGSLR